MSSSLPLDVPVKFGPYELTHRFEPSGKLGPAFRATHRGVEGFEKTLLIKQLDPRLSAEKVFLDSLVERVALAVRLHHANIVQVLDLGHAAERYFIATEFVAGCDYGAVLEMLRVLGQTLPEEHALLVAIEACKALDYAHRLRDAHRPPCIHGDLVPGNLLLSWDGEVKVADFGLATALQALPPDHQPATTRRYLAPELEQGLNSSPQSDVYALGALLFEGMGGQAALVDGVRRGSTGARDLAELGRVDPEFASLVDCMLLTEPNARCTQVADFHEPLLRFKSKRHPSANPRSLAGWLSQLSDAFQRLPPSRRAAASGVAAQLSGEMARAAAVPERERVAIELLPSQDVQIVEDEPPSPWPPGLERNLEQIEQLFAAARSQARVGLVVGASGAGKSHLLRYAASLYAERGALVLVSEACAAHIGLPLALASDWLGRALNVMPSASNAQLEDQIAALGSQLALSKLEIELCRQLLGLAARSFVSPGLRLETSAQVLLKLVDAYSKNMPVVLVADALQHADRASVALLQMLFEELGSHRVVLLMASSDPAYDDDLGHAAVRVLRQEEADTPTRRRLLEALVGVGGLSERTRGALAGMPESCAQLVELALFARTLARAGYPLEQGVGLLLTLDPARRLATAVQTLNPAEIQVLQWLAAATEPLHVDFLRQLVALPPAVLHGVLQKLLQLGFVIYATPGKLALPTRALAMTLLSLYDRSLVATLHEHLAHAVASVLRGGELVSELLLVREQRARAGVAALVVQDACDFDRTLLRAGYVELTVAHAQQALRSLQSTLHEPASEIARLQLVVARRALHLLQWDLAREQLDAVFRSAVAASQPALWIEALCVDALLLTALGRYATAIERIEEAQLLVHAAQGLSFPIFQEARARWCLAFGELFAAEDALDRSLASATNLPAEELCVLRSLLAQVLALRGRTERAQAEIELAGQLEQSAPSQLARIQLAIARATLASAQGPVDQACDELEMAYELASESGDLLAILQLAVPLVDALVKDGRATRARKVIASAERLAKRHSVQVVEKQIRLAQHYLGAAYRGEREGMEALRAALDEAIVEGIPSAVLRASEFLAEALERQGDRGAAERTHAIALDVRRSRGYAV